MHKIQNIVYSTKRTVECHGENKELGHPIVYLKISTDNKIICPYCSKEFIYAPQGHKST
jgi:uncharacterized Zn-finger protein